MRQHEPLDEEAEWLAIAQEGVEAACRAVPALRKGLNTYAGRCVYPSVAEACGLDYTPVEHVLGVK